MTTDTSGDPGRDCAVDGTRTFLALHRQADIAEMLAGVHLRCGVRYRAVGDRGLSDASDLNYLDRLTEERDLRATARDLSDCLSRGQG